MQKNCIVCAVNHVARAGGLLCAACQRSYDRNCRIYPTTAKLIEWAAKRARRFAPPK